MARPSTPSSRMGLGTPLGGGGFGGGGFGSLSYGMGAGPTGAPPTALGSLRPSSGLRSRLHTGKQVALPPTAAGSGATSGVGVGVGLDTNVRVAERPVTQQGMVGLNPGKPLGPSRQVYDKSYFLAELRQKCQELTEVCEDMNAQIGDFERNGSALAVLEKRRDACQRTVKGLQGKLADLNIVLDKAGTDTHPDEVQTQYLDLKERNDDERKRLNAVFTERSNMEQRTKDGEAQINAHKKSIESKLNELAPAKRKEYQELQAENKQLQMEKQRLENALQGMHDELISCNQDIGTDPTMQHALSLTEQSMHLSERKFELEAEENKLNLDPEEQQEELLVSVRQDKAEILGLEDQIAALRTTIVRLNERFGSPDKMPSGGENHAGLSYAEMEQRRRRLDELMEAAEGNIQNAQANLKAQKQTIVGSLESLLLHSKGADGAQQISDLKTELDYKQVQYQNSQHTSEQLRSELSRRREELAKIETLEEKIMKEVSTLKERIEGFQTDMAAMASDEELRAQGDEMQTALEVCRRQLLERKDLLETQVQGHKRDFDARQMALHALPKFTSFEKEEVKLRKNHQEVYSLEEFVLRKESEINCSDVAHDIMDQSNAVNALLKKMVLM